MTHDEIEKNRKRLADIVAKIENAEGNNPSVKELRQLAKDVGACVVESDMISGCSQWREATVSELVSNIHEALQTASMIDACRTAAENHEVALGAQESARCSQRVSVVAMLAAVASAVAVWIWH